MKIKEAAEALGVHANTVRRMIEDGRLKAEKVLGEWEISEEQIYETLNKSTSRMAEATNISIGADLIRDYQQASLRVSYRDLAQKCADVAQYLQTNGIDSHIDQKIDGLEKELQRLRILQAASEFVQGVKRHANKLDQEALEALRLQHKMIKNRNANKD